MSGSSASDSTTRPRRGSLLRLLLFNLVVVVAAVGIYFAVYVDARVKQTTVRNFRALDAAAERLTETVRNLPRIAENIPVVLPADRRGGGLGLLELVRLEADRERVEAEIRLLALASPNRDTTAAEATLQRLGVRLQTLRERLDARIAGASGLSPACFSAADLPVWLALGRIYAHYVSDFNAVSSLEGLSISALPRGRPGGASAGRGLPSGEDPAPGAGAAPAGGAGAGEGGVPDGSRCLREILGEQVSVAGGVEGQRFCRSQETQWRLRPGGDAASIEFHDCRQIGRASCRERVSFTV